MLLARDTWQETADWYTKNNAFPVTLEEGAWQNFPYLLSEGGRHFLRAAWCAGASPCAPQERGESRRAESPTLARRAAGAHAGLCSRSRRAALQTRTQTQTRAHRSEHTSPPTGTAGCTLPFSCSLMWDVKPLAKPPQNIQAMTRGTQNAKTWHYSYLRVMQQCHLQSLDKVLNASGRDKRFYVKSRQQQRKKTPNTTSPTLKFLVNSDKTICNTRRRWLLP